MRGMVVDVGVVWLSASACLQSTCVFVQLGSICAAKRPLLSPPQTHKLTSLLQDLVDALDNPLLVWGEIHDAVGDDNVHAVLLNSGTLEILDVALARQRLG